MRYTRELSFALVLLAAVPAPVGAEVSGSSRPGPVVVDVRGRVDAGYARGLRATYSIAPEVLFLWPGGYGIGLDLGCSAAGVFGGALSVVNVGVKYAMVRRSGRSPLCSKAGTGVELVVNSNGRIGVGARLEVGLTLLAARQIAFPIEASATIWGSGSGGAGLTLGLSLGAGWVFVGR